VSEIGDPMAERPLGRSMVEKMSNVNVNFGDPGLVDRDQAGYLGVSSMLELNLSMINTESLLISDQGKRKRKKITREQTPTAGGYCPC